MSLIYQVIHKILSFILDIVKFYIIYSLNRYIINIIENYNRYLLGESRIVLYQKLLRLLYSLNPLVCQYKVITSPMTKRSGRVTN